ncbi:MAG: hypothetical protein BA872_00925 [Desulfobacterales bacterium C00003060]|nr:MAG: hypothetical protein BA872_00925 [Desulfobacterales bacterium C00003060]
MLAKTAGRSIKRTVQLRKMWSDSHCWESPIISLIIRQPFDYTKWQRDLWPDESVEELSKKAMEAIRMESGEQGA